MSRIDRHARGALLDTECSHHTLGAECVEAASSSTKNRETVEFDVKLHASYSLSAAAM